MSDKKSELFVDGRERIFDPRESIVDPFMTIHRMVYDAAVLALALKEAVCTGYQLAIEDWEKTK